MNGSRKPTTDAAKLTETLAGLAEMTRTTDPHDLQAVVDILTRVEDAVDLIGDETPAPLLEAIAGGLRAVVLDEVSDPAGAMHSLSDSAAVVEQFLGAEQSDAAIDMLTGAVDALQQALCGEMATELGGADASMISLDDVAARLVGYSCEDRTELREICKQLESFASHDAVGDDATQTLRVAAAFIEQAILASTDDPEKSLASASEFLAEAMNQVGDIGQLECSMSPTESAEVVGVEAIEAAPAPVAETAAEPASDTSESEVAILPADADMEILKDYIVESLDHIEASEASLLELETNPDDIELVNTIFRAFHTIKGTSGFFGLVRNQELAHLAENLLDRARSGELKLTGGYADLCLQSCDALRLMIQSVEQAAPGGALEMPDNLEELMLNLSDPEARGFGEEAYTEPMRVGDILVGTGAADRADVEAAVAQGGAKPLGQKLVEQNKVSAQDVATALRTQKQGSGAAAEATVRVATDRLDAMVNMVGELVIAHSMVAEDAAATGQGERSSRNLAHAGKIIRDLQDLTMSLRMVPLKGLFRKMSRLVRDLGRNMGKSIKLVTEGEDTEIDRSMVELLNDPLLHMIRNSVDHGIESAADRVAAGKPAEGTVVLRAYHSAGNVVIELQDDGQGLNREKIVAKAVERGLITADQTLSDSDAYGLIWQPGFSTAEKVTDVSGRGVGMDVVKRSIEELRGRIETASEPGAGSTFTVRLPLTMAIADAMLVRVGQERYLLPTIAIEQSFRPDPKDVSSVVNQGEMVMLRGDLLPVFRLQRLFAVPDAVTDINEGILIVIEGEDKRCAVMVDELLGQHQVVIKTLGDTFGHIDGVSGGAILGDGHVGLILDAGGLIQLATTGQYGDEPLRDAG